MDFTRHTKLPEEAVASLTKQLWPCYVSPLSEEVPAMAAFFVKVHLCWEDSELEKVFGITSL